MDGFGACYAAQKKFGNTAQYLPVNYGDVMPVIEDGSSVYILDFSYPRDVLEALNARVDTLVVLDHHKTAQEDLKDLPYAIFDMNKSGAVLAWEFFFPTEPVPKILTRVQDRDLWRWQYKDTRDVLNSLEMAKDDFSVWDWAEQNFEKAAAEGLRVSEYKAMKVEEACDPQNFLRRTFMGYQVAIMNSSAHMTSEVGNKVVTENSDIDIFIGYSILPNGRVYLSFRSAGIDTTPLARHFGGGGHAKASGALTSLDVLKEFYDTP